MSTQHTPGPWTIRNRSIVQVWSEQGGIAQVYSQAGQAANARLIAAAPEMKDSLRDLLDVLSDVSPCQGCEPATCVVHRASALLARIEGGNNG